MSKLGYECTEEVDVIRRRRTHLVGFRVGTSSELLRTFLAKVPPNASVNQVIDDDAIITIEFYEDMWIEK